MTSVGPIFLVDDDEDDRFFLREAFEGITTITQIVEFADGQQLIDLLGSQTTDPKPALIVLDMIMPRMSGLEVLSRIKADPVSRDIPVVMVSTSSDQDLIQVAYRQGVNSYITKPITQSQYSGIVQGIISTYLSS
jgi:CheY-like chemotaxis protein